MDDDMYVVTFDLVHCVRRIVFAKSAKEAAKKARAEISIDDVIDWASIEKCKKGKEDSNG